MIMITTTMIMARTTTINRGLGLRPRRGTLLAAAVFFAVACAAAAAVAYEANRVNITERGGYRIIDSNGIPDHAAGTFPNRGNPNTIREQQHHYRVPLDPTLRSASRPLDGYLFGVAVNGVPFDPGTAEFWNRDRRSGWRYDALSGKIDLGVDSSHAHVQPDGTYHYHGIPDGLTRKLGGSGKKLVGYAADGFGIYYLPSARSSWRLKSGTRPGGPGGRYDGTFDEDFEYVQGAGDLDACNGMTVPRDDGGQTYEYYLTSSYPFVPRCFRGDPDPSFRHSGPGGAMGPGAGGMSGPGGAGRPGMQGDGRRPPAPPQEAVRACSGRSAGSPCSFRSPHGTVTGTCRDIGGQTACAPAGGPGPRP